MAINITPIRDTIKQVIDYKVYNGNHNLTPINVDFGAVVLTCTGSYPYSTPLSSRTEREEIEDQYYEYTYQIDIMRTVGKKGTSQSLVPFEKEAYTIINKLHSDIPRLARDYGLTLTRIRCRQFMDMSYERPTHRLVGDFSIYSHSIVKIRSELEQVECTQVTYKFLKPHQIMI